VKRGDLVCLFDSFSDSDSVYSLPVNPEDSAVEIPHGAAVLVLDPHSEEAAALYGPYSDEVWVKVLWEEREWYVYSSDISPLKKRRRRNKKV
jgi:hypothetical protein